MNPFTFRTTSRLNLCTSFIHLLPFTMYKHNENIMFKDDVYFTIGSLKPQNLFSSSLSVILSLSASGRRIEMNSIRSTIRTACIARQFATTAAKRDANVAEGYKKIKSLQEKFQRDTGELIHVKGGTFDRVLYQVTAALCTVGLGYCVKVYWDLS